MCYEMRVIKFQNNKIVKQAYYNVFKSTIRKVSIFKYLSKLYIITHWFQNNIFSQTKIIYLKFGILFGVPKSFGFTMYAYMRVDYGWY